MRDLAHAACDEVERAGLTGRPVLWSLDRARIVRELDRVARESERDKRERAKLDQERDKREEELRRQLEAMQSIERGIIERQEKLRRQTPSAAPKR
jgi:septal ring factor EnvC (AmiA/AmiB activator)